MSAHPLLYEINTRCWLRALSERAGRTITLADIPSREFVRWRDLGFTHIWLMGVWKTGPRSRAVTLGSEDFQARLDQILPGWRRQDVPGSPFAIGAYEVSDALGGAAGLKAFHHRLHDEGLKLLLDFVPNHLGLDHPWVAERPDLFVQSELPKAGTFMQLTINGPRRFAHGKDPHFPPWNDTAQLDYRRPETRSAMRELLRSISCVCDGVRCDMTMLLINEVFARTWAHFPAAFPPPATEFWADAVTDIRESQPDFLFLAEAYWGLEARLQALGFDYTYEKEIYDHLLGRRFADLQKRLLDATPAYLAASAHFLENHDERRIASILSPAEHRAVALLLLGLPGMRILHEGQLQGWRLHVPVQLGRWPGEPADPEITALYEQLLGVLRESAVGRGEWRILRPHGWPDNPSAENFVIVQWQRLPLEFDLVVVNLASHPGQCVVQPAVEGLDTHNWKMRDLLGEESYHCNGRDLAEHGLHLDLPGHGAQLLRFNSP